MGDTYISKTPSKRSPIPYKPSRTMAARCRLLMGTILPMAACTILRVNRTQWKPEPCDELAPGVPCVQLYKHPAGSGLVTPCPVDTHTNVDGCAAYLTGKSDAEKCPQIKCPKALGVTFKLVCAGGCCPTCWAPDHVVKVDRHTAIKSTNLVPRAAAAPPTCEGAKCFTPLCGTGYKPGFVQGNCCESCIPA